jgi:antitoxin component of MazEF toxin-antitoxin module
MSKALVKTQRMGGSITVRIPKEIIEQEGIGAYELVEIEVRKAKKGGYGALKGVGRFTRKDELDTPD